MHLAFRRWESDVKVVGRGRMLYGQRLEIVGGVITVLAHKSANITMSYYASIGRYSFKY